MKTKKNKQKPLIGIGLDPGGLQWCRINDSGRMGGTFSFLPDTTPNGDKLPEHLTLQGACQKLAYRLEQPDLANPLVACAERPQHKRLVSILRELLGDRQVVTISLDSIGVDFAARQAKQWNIRSQGELMAILAVTVN